MNSIYYDIQKTLPAETDLSWENRGIKDTIKNVLLQNRILKSKIEIWKFFDAHKLTHVIWYNSEVYLPKDCLELVDSYIQ